MIDFSTLRGLTIPEGIVVQVNNGDVIYWRASDSGSIVLEVEKITSDTYAGETSYKNEAFILLDIYPNSGGTVNITYGELTKTITDDGTSENPNAQQVFFGTFNGVSDSIETPTSGTLTINGDCVGFAVGTYDEAKKSTNKYFSGIIAVNDFGAIDTIPAEAFRNCNRLTSVVIPSSITSIGSGAFYGCMGLKSVVIPSSITSIGTYAFSICSSLTSVVIPSSITSIPNYAFSDCAGLTSINIPSSVTSIGFNAFAGCVSLTSFDIPSSVTSIDSYAFDGCTRLTSVVIPASVTSIGVNPWRRCFENNAISVADGNTAYTISGNCLVEIDSLTIVSGFADADIFGALAGSLGVTSIGAHAFYGCNSLTSVTFPQLLNSIGAYAFYDCNGLTNVTIPDCFRLYIGDYAFYLSSGNTRTITLLSEDPCTLQGSSVFDVAGTNKIVVPAGCGKAYKTAEYWSEYADYIVEAS